MLTVASLKIQLVKMKQLNKYGNLEKIEDTLVCGSMLYVSFDGPNLQCQHLSWECTSIFSLIVHTPDSVISTQMYQIIPINAVSANAYQSFTWVVGI